MTKPVLKSSLFCATVGILALSACAQSKSPQGNNPDQYLSQYHWNLQSAVNQNNQPITAFYAGQQQPKFTLNFDKGRLSLHGSCNQMGGSYTATGSTLQASEQIMSTLMACAPAAMQQDGSMSKFFAGQKLNYQIDKQNQPILTLTNKQGDKLRFVGAQTADSQYGSAPETIFMAVSHQKRACSDGLRKNLQCLRVKEIRYDAQGLKTYEAKEWSNFYNNIEGFTHRADIDTVLRVKRYTVANPPADASKYAYVLDMVVSQAMVK